MSTHHDRESHAAGWGGFRVDAAQRARARRRAAGWVACTDLWAAEDAPIGPTGTEALG